MLEADTQIPEVQERFHVLGTYTRDLTPDQTGEFLRSEERGGRSSDRWRQRIRSPRASGQKNQSGIFAPGPSPASCDGADLRTIGHNMVLTASIGDIPNRLSFQS
jgi:hypothetical protein